MFGTRTSNLISSATASGRTTRTAMAISAATRSIVETVAQTVAVRCLLGAPACWGPGSLSVPSAIHLSSSSRSPADCHRASGSLARHFLMTRSSDEGVIGCRVDIAGGSRSRIAAIRLAWLCPSNERLPVTISYTIAPKAKMSARGSASFPSSCSGAMYCRVPRMVPSAVIGVRVGRPVVPNGPRPSATSFASPKSTIFAPDLVSTMLPGLRSRCTMFCRCALSSASAS